MKIMEEIKFWFLYVFNRKVLIHRMWNRMFELAEEDEKVLEQVFRGEDPVRLARERKTGGENE